MTQIISPPPNPLDRIAFDWGERCFGQNHMFNLQLRALRMLEEALEFCQAVEVKPELMRKQVEEVCSRPRGDHYQEMGGLILTTRMICVAMNWDPEELYLCEIRRCLSKDPKDFAKRNQEKLMLGLGKE